MPGATYFFTVTVRDRRSDLLVAYVDHLRAAFREVRRTRPFVIDAIVILPDHLHAVWTEGAHPLGNLEGVVKDLIGRQYPRNESHSQSFRSVEASPREQDVAGVRCTDEAWE